MAQRIRFRPTYSSVTSTLALFVALSGGAYAATALEANSVGPRHIKKSAVERAKIKNNAIDSSKILDNVVSGSDIKESTLEKVPAATLADKATSAAALDRVVYRSAAGSAPPFNGNSATAGCEPGLRAIGGGVQVADPFNAFIVDGYPDAGNTAWTGRVGNSSGNPIGFTVFVICAAATAVG